MGLDKNAGGAKRKVILHVGPHKTGTTAMQRSFFSGSKTLQRAGICYPEAGIRYIAHHKLVDWARDRKTDFHPGQFIKEIEPFERVLISSEDFAHLSEENLKKVVALFSNSEIEVVFYLRRLVDLWPSYWQELTKHGQTMSFREYLADTLLGTEGKRSRHRLDQIAQLQALNTVFGQDSVHIMGYDRIREANGNLVTELIQRFFPEAREVELPDIQETNKSNQPWQTTLFRAFNHLWREQYKERASFRLRNQLLQALSTDEIAWKEEFIAEEQGLTQKVKIDSGWFSVMALQTEFIRRYSEQIIDGKEDSSAAYLKPTSREVLDASFPLEMKPELLAAMKETLLDLARKLGRQE